MKNRSAFTLIELLVVVLIIGILAAVALPQYQKAIVKSRYNTLKPLTNSIAKAEEVYYLSNGTFTDELANLEIELSGGAFNNESPRKYVYDWGYCGAFFSQSTQEKLTISCRNTDIDMGYVTTLEVGQATRSSCYVYGSAKPDGRPWYNQICKEETNRTQKSGSSTATADVLYVRYQYP